MTENNDLIDRVAKAMYGTIAHAYSWELAREDCKDVWRREAVAALSEIAAIAQLQERFPDMERIN